jgi:hypothetical protein
VAATPTCVLSAESADICLPGVACHVKLAVSSAHRGAAVWVVARGTFWLTVPASSWGPTAWASTLVQVYALNVSGGMCSTPALPCARPILAAIARGVVRSVPRGIILEVLAVFSARLEPTALVVVLTMPPSAHLVVEATTWTRQATVKTVQPTVFPAATAISAPRPPKDTI